MFAIIRNGEPITLTDDEVIKAYRYQQHQFRTRDAQAHLYDLVGYTCNEPDDSPDNIIALQSFADRYGFSLSEAVNQGSDYYLLDVLVERYEESLDCNLAENELWEQIVEQVLNEVVCLV